MIARREDEGIEGRAAIGCVCRGEGNKNCDENEITNDKKGRELVIEVKKGSEVTK